MPAPTSAEVKELAIAMFEAPPASSETQLVVSLLDRNEISIPVAIARLRALKPVGKKGEIFWPSEVATD